MMTEDWKPLSVVREDMTVTAPVRRLAALLDHDGDHSPSGELPPLGHWLFFLPEERQSDLTADGHPARGSFLPPIGAPRRMWAGSDILFHAPIPIGMAVRRTSIVTDVTEKRGSTGTLTFVRVRHDITEDGRPLVTEHQDLVFRADGAPAKTAAPSARAATVRREVALDEAALFRFSALTFNAHRIHYDRAYAQTVEGYPALVVHGPFQAVLLIDHLLRHIPERRIARFRFRGANPLFEQERAALNLAPGDDGMDLWTTNEAGAECMTATAWLAPVAA